MANDTLTVRLRVNRRRMRAMTERLVAQVKRARKGDRPAILHRGARAIVRDCLRIDTGGLRFGGSGATDGRVSPQAYRIGINTPEYVVVPRAVEREGST